MKPTGNYVFDDFRIPPRAIRALASSIHTSKLSGLSIQNSVNPQHWLRILGNAPGLPALRLLSLTNSDISPEELPELLNGSGLQKVDALNMDGNPLGNAGLELLLQSPWTARLRSLRLMDCGLDEDAFRMLCGAPDFRPEYLDVGMCEEGTFEIPPDAAFLSTLSALWLKLKMTQPKLSQLIAPVWPKLELLDLMGSELTNLQLLLLAEAVQQRKFPQLKMISFLLTNVTGECPAEARKMLGKGWRLMKEGQTVMGLKKTEAKQT